MIAAVAAVATVAGLSAISKTDAQGLPDLVVLQSTLGSSIRFEKRTFSSDSCAVQEGMTVVGLRTLLRFTVTFPNRGDAALHIGDPRSNPLFYYSPCHRHYHFKEYADYRLWTPAGYEAWLALKASNPGVLSRTLLNANPAIAAQLVEGNKRGFCMYDLKRDPEATVRRPRTYNSCGYQGVSVGWADEYSYKLDGQWIDITGVAGGSYVLEVEVDAERIFPESDYDNNSTAVSITVP
jgi:hypothetical protein